MKTTTGKRWPHFCAELTRKRPDRQNWSSKELCSESSLGKKRAKNVQTPNFDCCQDNKMKFNKKLGINLFYRIDLKTRKMNSNKDGIEALSSRKSQSPLNITTPLNIPFPIQKGGGGWGRPIWTECGKNLEKV